MGDKPVSQVITLSSGRYRVLTPKEVTRLSVKGKGRVIVDRFDNPVLVPEETDEKYVKALLLTIVCFILLVLSAAVLLWGRSPGGVRLGVVIPLLILLLTLSAALIRVTLSYHERSPIFTWLLPIPVVAAFCWSFVSLEYIRWIGFAGCGVTLFSWLVLILKSRPKEREVKRLKNSNPHEALKSFYDLLLTEDDHREEAVQYLACFRENTLSGKAENRHAQWRLTADVPHGDEQVFEEAKDLPSLARDLVDRTVATRYDSSLLKKTYGKGRCDDYVFLRPLEPPTSGERIVAYIGVNHFQYTEQWASPTSDWDVKIGETSMKTRHDVRKVFIKFDGGWFLESGKYDSASLEDVRELREAKLFRW